MKEENIDLSSVFMDHSYEWFEKNSPESIKLKNRGNIYTEAITVWLMINQKISKENNLSTGVVEIKTLRRGGELSKLISNSNKYIFREELSTNVSSYCKSIDRVRVETIEALSDEIVKKNEKEHEDISKIHGYRVFLVDGTVVSLENVKDIKQEYVCQSNQHGENAPAARIVSVHNVITGTTIRPEIGTIKDSEQKLSLEVFNRLPAKCLIIGDRNFGVFFVVLNAKKANQKSLIRLTESRACKLLGKSKIDTDGVHQITWSPSDAEKKKYTVSEKDSVAGRLIAVTLNNKGFRSERFYFFTTDQTLDEQVLVSLYKMRWYIETDFNTLKHTTHLDKITSKKAKNVKKEILVAFLSYNLIRTVIARGAKILKMLPREFSFISCVRLLKIIAVNISSAKTIAEFNSAINSFLPGLRQAKHPNREKKRLEPRKIVRRKSKFPTMKLSRQEERKKILLQIQ